MNNDEQVTENEAMDALRAANPITDADDEARAGRIYAAVTDREHTRVASGRRPALAIAGGMAALAIAAAGVFAVTRGGGDPSGTVPAGGDEPSVTVSAGDPDTPTPAASDAVSVDIESGAAMSCAFGYSVETLRERDFAFVGTLVETGVQPAPTPLPPAEMIPGAEGVTFQVDEWFRGPGGETITLQGSGLPIGYGSIVNEGATLQVGDRYLVSGDDVFVWTCGFTKTYSESMAQEWREAFSGQ